jgi:xanthine dehydrogenase YagR molybdenum-binding subunit
MASWFPQLIGGIGMALMEHSVVDGRNGRIPNANFAEYAVPVQGRSWT